MTRGGFSRPPIAGAVPAGLVSVLAGAYGIGVVALFASGRMSLFQAGLLLGVPVVLALAVLRPEWVILVLVAIPPSVTSPVPPLQMIAIMFVALFGFLLQGRLQLGPKTGIYPLVGIIALAFVMKADTSADARATGDATLKFFVYYALLMLVAFQACSNGRMRIDTFVNALLLGIVGTTILQPFLGGQSFDAINQTPFRGQFAYLATMGFGVAYVRASLRRSEGLSQSAFDVFLMVVFFFLTAIGFGRASWMAALLVFALVSLWTGRKSFWIASSLFLVLVLTVPVVGERIVPGGSGGNSNVTLARVTTGRSDLWGELFERGAEELSLGHGWGYTWSLTSSEIFGFEGQFGAEGDGYVYPHNDFLFLFVELGILGLGLLLAQWLLLIRQVRFLSHRRGSEQARYDVRILVPVMIVMFFVQLFDNAFAIRFVAERFFIVAGLAFGLSYLRPSGRSNAVDSRFLRTSQGFVLPDD